MILFVRRYSSMSTGTTQNNSETVKGKEHSTYCVRICLTRAAGVCNLHIWMAVACGSVSFQPYCMFGSAHQTFLKHFPPLSHEERLDNLSIKQVPRMYKCLAGCLILFDRQRAHHGFEKCLKFSRLGFEVLSLILGNLLL